MKYLVIVALITLFLLLVYSKLYPYIQAVKKMLGAAQSMADAPPNRSDGGKGATKGGRKLVKCVGCGTWVPAERAVGAGGQSVYCSRECIERAANGSERKMAG